VLGSDPEGIGAAVLLCASDAMSAATLRLDLET
jgi:hypothetical protein